MLYKRHAALVAFWADGAPVLRNYARGTTIPLTAALLDLLQALGQWRTLDQLADACGETDRQAFAARLLPLVEAGFVERTGEAPRENERALSAWQAWSPSAAFFHLDTKDVAFADREGMTRANEWRAFFDPPPPRVEGPAVVALPPVPRRGALPSVLLARRSWRRFGSDPIALQDLSALLGLTWGTQRWMKVDARVSVPLKTSPSGGACHSLETYVAVRQVEGLEPGLYRYAPDAHGLSRIGPPLDAEELTKSLGGQAWAADAGAVCFMTSVFSRVQWRYAFARAYRIVLMEAGHFCQTFCLVATWLKLAPFCTAALADSRIERTLGIDGVGESVLYAMGVGSRPAGASWAPWPDVDQQPETFAPASRRHLPARRRRGAAPRTRS